MKTGYLLLKIMIDDRSKNVTIIGFFFKLQYRLRSSFPFSLGEIYSQGTSTFKKRELGHYFSTSACKARRSASQAQVCRNRGGQGE